MKLRFKILFLVLIYLIAIPSYADFGPISIATPVDAKNAAKMHNNLGNEYVKEKDFFAAIKEYRIAIGINSDAQTTAVTFNNLGKVYLILGEIQKQNKLKIQRYDDFSIMAQVSFEEAILKDCMKIEYYQNLIKAYKLTGAMNSKKEYFLNNKSKNPFNVIPAALILQEEGEFDMANMLLDDFISENPDIIISRDLKKLIKVNNGI